MRVTLAYPWTDSEGVEHAPDATVDVPAATAERLLRNGKARPAGPEISSAPVDVPATHDADVPASVTEPSPSAGIEHEEW